VPGFLFVYLALQQKLSYFFCAGLSGIRSQGGVKLPTGGKGGNSKPASAWSS
jgi:hypothetical protein